MMRARAAVALLALLLGLSAAQAQTPNFNFIVPTAPLGTLNNQAASTEFVQNSVAAGVSGVGSIGGAIGIITLGSGLSIPGNVLTNTGVLSVDTATGALLLGSGLSRTGATLLNSGVLSLGGSTGALTLGSGLSIPGGALTNSGVLSVGGATGALALGSGLTISGVTLNTLAPGDACTGPRLAKTADYPVVNADRFSKFSLGGSGFFTLTFNAASGYDANFSACIHNTDTGRGKHIAVDGGKDFILWPDQVAVISNDNNSWAVRRPNRWKVPNSYGPITLQTNFSIGTAPIGAATDCLGTGTQACKSVQDALGLAITDFDFDGNASGQSSLVVRMADGITDTQGVHFSPHALIPGSQGGFSITIQGGTASIMSVAGDSAFNFFLNAHVRVKDVYVASGGACVQANFGSHVYLDGVKFRQCDGGAVAVYDHSRVEQSGVIYIADVGAVASSYGIIAQRGGMFNDNGFGISFLGNASYTTFLLAQSNGILFVSGVMNPNGHALAGQSYQVDTSATMATSAFPVAFSPGLKTAGGTYNGSL